jgi:predicted RNA-binding protein YlqC (UPF0109 family)
MVSLLELRHVESLCGCPPVALVVEIETGMAERQDDMQELVTEIARALVDEPGAVVVDAVERDENTVLRLRVAPADVGKVIGKQGRTARSMRTILGAVSMKHHHRYTLDILEEDGEKLDGDPRHAKQETPVHESE